MGKAGSTTAYAGAWFAWVLDFIGWVILLSGVAAMQASCGGSDANFLLSGGSASYNGAVSCDVFFSYTWWMTFFNFFLLIATAVVLGSGRLASYRPGLITLSAVAAMQSIIIANNYLYYDTLPTSSGAFVARAKTATAGAIIKAIGTLLMIAFLGARDESTTVFEPPAKKEQFKGGYRMAQAPVGPPPGTNVLEPETLEVRPGRVGSGGGGGVSGGSRPTTTVMPV